MIDLSNLRLALQVIVILLLAAGLIFGVLLPLLRIGANRLDPWLEALRLLARAEREMTETPPNLPMATRYLNASKKALDAVRWKGRHPYEVPGMVIRQHSLGARINELTRRKIAPSPSP